MPADDRVEDETKGLGLQRRGTNPSIVPTARTLSNLDMASMVAPLKMRKTPQDTTNSEDALPHTTTGAPSSPLPMAARETQMFNTPVTVNMRPRRPSQLDQSSGSSSSIFGTPNRNRDPSFPLRVGVNNGWLETSAFSRPPTSLLDASNLETLAIVNAEQESEKAELLRSKKEMQRNYEEMQRSNEEMQRSTEELQRRTHDMVHAHSQQMENLLRDHERKAEQWATRLQTLESEVTALKLKHVNDKSHPEVMRAEQKVRSLKAKMAPKDAGGPVSLRDITDFFKDTYPLAPPPESGQSASPWSLGRLKASCHTDLADIRLSKTTTNHSGRTLYQPIIIDTQLANITIGGAQSPDCHTETSEAVEAGTHSLQTPSRRDLNASDLTVTGPPSFLRRRFSSTTLRIKHNSQFSTSLLNTFSPASRGVSDMSSESVLLPSPRPPKPVTEDVGNLPSSPLSGSSSQHSQSPASGKKPGFFNRFVRKKRSKETVATPSPTTAQPPKGLTMIPEDQVLVTETTVTKKPVIAVPRTNQFARDIAWSRDGKLWAKLKILGKTASPHPLTCTKAHAIAAATGLPSPLSPLTRSHCGIPAVLIAPAIKALVELGTLNPTHLDTLRRRYTSLPTFKQGTIVGPLHPETLLPWDHINLYCLDCPGPCPRCGNACCAYQRELVVIQDQAKTPQQRTKSNFIVRAIQHAVQSGYDTPTYLKCFKCSLVVCPSCCGRCSEPFCKAVVCKACGVPCGGHKMEEIPRLPAYLSEIEALEKEVRAFQAARIARGLPEVRLGPKRS